MGLDRSEVQAERREARAQLFREILERRALTCVFQPILNFHGKSIYGYEALIRGPRDSIFQSPVDLFDAAEDTGSVIELSVICVNTVLHQFSRNACPENCSSIFHPVWSRRRDSMPCVAEAT